ncbi:histidine phosphatase family protein [Oceanobacillus longus]|uniref:Histidine phosphatase family protein n=1 Tax=Oceanobacillus longus TaxID=930120 RepID=A0ABV8GSY7_9BACI
MRRIYFVRHCSADGQHKDSPLTRAGIRQAGELANFFNERKIPVDIILSSPYLRAVESIKPYAEMIGKTIIKDERLKERILSEDPVEDWVEALNNSFLDDSYKLSGGESAQDVVARSIEVLQQIYKDASIKNAIVVSHGNLLSHLFNQFDEKFGFEQSKELRNPDIYLLQLDHNSKFYNIECVWKPR